MWATRYFTVLPSLLALLSIPATSLVIQPHSPLEPLPPSRDPFYTAPHGFEKTKPGTILRIRHAPGNATTVIANSSAVYNIVYRTTNSNYEPSFAVTTLFVPLKNATSATNSSQTSLLSIQIAYNTAWVDSTPSYGIYYDLAQSVLGAPSGNDDVSYALNRGWYVNQPDHEGPTAAFTMGLTSGHATIDSIRAVLSSGLLPEKTTKKYAMWGYSGGSLASEWASELQEQYAPELNFAGMAIGGLIPNQTEVRDNLTGSVFNGLLPSMYLGLTSENADARAYLVSRLKKSGPYNATYFLDDLHYNVNEAFAAYAYQDFFGYFINGRADLEAPILKKIVDRNLYQGYHGFPKMPVFAYKAIGDQFSPVKTSDALVKRWCDINVDVEYQRNTIGEHVSEIVNGRQRALDWLASIFDGTAKVCGCSVKDVTVNVTAAS